MVELSQVFRALSDPNRLEIYRLIRERKHGSVAELERSISVLAREFDLSLDGVASREGAAAGRPDPLRQAWSDGLLRARSGGTRGDRGLPRGTQVGRGGGRCRSWRASAWSRGTSSGCGWRCSRSGCSF